MKHRPLELQVDSLIAVVAERDALLEQRDNLIASQAEELCNAAH